MSQSMILPLLPILPLLSQNAAFARLIPYEVALVLIYAVNFYVIVIVIWAVLSWFKGSKGFINELYQILGKIVKPYVDLFRKIIPSAGGMDFSPLIAIILLQVIVRVLVGL